MRSDPRPEGASAPSWPDPLQAPTSIRVETLLSLFWSALGELGNQLAQNEYLLANEQTTQLRAIVLEMMLALNGIQRPPDTRHLNDYLSADQRAAIEKTMALPQIEPHGWIGQAVSLVTIYRWYAPQLTAKYTLPYPSALEDEVWSTLSRQLPDWPQSITSD